MQAIEKVTVADVDRVARQYLNLDQAIVAVLTPTASGKPVTTGGFGRQETVQIKSTGKVTLPEWASSLLNRLTMPASNLNPVVTVLPNGLKLIVQPESVSDSVMVYGEIKNQPGLQEPRGQEGVSQVLEQLFPYGTATMDRLALEKARDDIGAEVKTGNFILREGPSG